jgi:hypothetical protein
MKTKPSFLAAALFLATLGTALGQPTITNQPQSQTVVPGTNVTFEVGATGAAPLAYQWQKGPNLFNITDLPGETNSTCPVANVQAANEGYYQVVVTNFEGAVTSTAAYLSVIRPPTIATADRQPTNWPMVSIGAKVMNRVIASSTQPMTYQWRFNGSPLAGQTKSSITLTNVQMADAGSYDVAVSNIAGSTNSKAITLVVDPIYTQVLTGPVVTDSEGGWNAEWIDYDQDGFLDLVVQRGITAGAALMSVYHNNRDGTFTRVTTGTLATTAVSSRAGAWGDYDNDAHVDLFVPNLSGVNDMLFHNDGNGTFHRILNDPVVLDHADTQVGTWLDYDRDGFMDLFVVSAGNDLLYRNNGDGTFRRLTVADVGPILTDTTWTEQAVAVDMDNDGLPEISRNVAGAGDNYTNELWHLDSQGKFARMNIGDMGNPGVGHTILLWADYDNDGFEDAAMGAQNTGFRLYRNLQGQGFTNVTANAGLPSLNSEYPQWADYDNDGWQDLFAWTTSGYRLFRNNGNGTFTAADIGSPLRTGAGGGIYWGDCDNDGFLDLLVVYGPGIRNALFHHNGNTNHWLKVKLDGRASNRSGLGAKVRVLSTIGGRTFWQMREISGAGVCFDNGLIAHLGLGDATNVTTLLIEWPSGIVQTITNVAANQFLTVVEHQDYGGGPPAFAGATIVTNGLQVSITEPAAGARYCLEASTDLVNWTKVMACTSAGGTRAYTDTRAVSYPQRFYRVVVP